MELFEKIQTECQKIERENFGYASVDNFSFHEGNFEVINSKTKRMTSYGDGKYELPLCDVGDAYDMFDLALNPGESADVSLFVEDVQIKKVEGIIGPFKLFDFPLEGMPFMKLNITVYNESAEKSSCIVQLFYRGEKLYTQIRTLQSYIRNPVIICVE